MDSYQALRKDLEVFAKELDIKNFQALSPGLGIGTLAQKNSLKHRGEIDEPSAAPSFVAPALRKSVVAGSPVAQSGHYPQAPLDALTAMQGHQKAKQSQPQLNSTVAIKGDEGSFGSPIHQESFPSFSPLVKENESSTASRASNQRANERANQSSKERGGMSRPHDTFIARPMQLGAESPRTRRASAGAPWWAWILGHIADLLVVCLCLAVCAYGVSLMVPDFRSIKFLKLAPGVWISVLYGTLMFYTLIFKLLGIPLMGSLIRRGFSPEKATDEKAPSSI